MKYVQISFFGIFLATSFVMAQNAHATVGGGSFFNNFGYSEELGVVRYQNYDNGGRGCPPELFEYNPVTNETTTVLNCSEAYSGTDAYEDYEARLEEFMLGFEPLARIDLAKNGLTVNASVVDGYDPTLTNRYMITEIPHVSEVFQNGNKIAELDFNGCLFGQKVNFDGFAIPNSEDLLMIVSTRSICFEYLYIGEVVFPIQSVSIIDSRPLSDRRFEDLPLSYPQEVSDSTVNDAQGGLQVVVPDRVQEESRFLNNLGFAAYLDGRYDVAVGYFRGAYYLDNAGAPGSYLLAGFNLAATESKLGKTEDALRTIDTLLRSAQEVGEKDHYIQKIIDDTDFDSVRNTDQYKILIGAPDAPDTPVPTPRSTPRIIELPESLIGDADVSELEKMNVVIITDKGDKASVSKPDSNDNNTTLIVIGGIVAALILGVLAGRMSKTS